MNIEKAIEILQCAEYNCDNIKKLGPIMADGVKMQIQIALKELGGELETEDVEASLEK